ncbi:MAG: DUF2760 domain-containing protein [Thermodesulfobacteriota bacterium]
MDLVKPFSRRCLFWLLALNLLLFAVVYGVHYSAFPGWIKDFWETRINIGFIPSAAALFVFIALLQWAVLRGTLKKLLQRHIPAEEAAARKSPAADKKGTVRQETGPSPKEIEKQHQRYYLHLVSVLQRQGRLLDFFREDLGPYSDAQIGAAVRSVHENCSKTLEKYLAPRGVMDKAEGSEVTVDSDFDPSKIKLTGNVTGEPPFKGVVRHPGWKAAKLELPVLSDSGDPLVIAPAEVEVK